MSEHVKLVVKKVIKASQKEVFDAWTQPELMKQWYAPGEMKVPNASADLNIGGAYSVEMKGEMGGEQVNPVVSGTYRKIIPNKLISFTWSWQDDPTPETLVTVQFDAVSGGTEVTLTHDRFGSIEARDKHQHGWLGCLENLSRHFAR
jgi:uncharacterized protein YndB with AHSA1/START domain